MKHLYNQSLSLLTDFYQLTMSYAYWKAGLDKKEAVFHLFFRKKTFGGGFTITAGLEGVIDYLQNFHFSKSDLDYLAEQKSPQGNPLFEEGFLNYLEQLDFSCDVDAIPEGNVVFPYEPLVRVKGPLIQCQILESPLLNLINFPSLIATKAARLCIATQGDPILEFGMRRAQGIDGALTAARAAFVGGCTYTSNVMAGKLFDIPIVGTHSHSWIMVFDDEHQAFETYAKQLPENCIFLVDTYNSIDGVKRAIEVSKKLRSRGKEMIGIRLDSGDLNYLSIVTRKLLDEAGFPDAKIFATNELDETIISDLKRQGCKVNVWGVGTKLVTAYSQPALDGVYKISAIRDPGGPWKYKLKLSEQLTKVSNPGILQIRRFKHDGEYVGDAIYDIHQDLSSGCKFVDPFDPTRQKNFGPELESFDLLQPIYREGKLIYNLPNLKEIQQKTKTELDCFHEGIKRFLNPHQYPVGLEKNLYALKTHLIKNIRSQQTYITPEQ